jgi:hypothetical protein
MVMACGRSQTGDATRLTANDLLVIHSFKVSMIIRDEGDDLSRCRLMRENIFDTSSEGKDKSHSDGASRSCLIHSILRQFLPVSCGVERPDLPPAHPLAEGSELTAAHGEWRPEVSPGPS